MLDLSRFSKITNSHHQQTVQYTIFPKFNVLLRSLGNLFFYFFYLNMHYYIYTKNLLLQAHKMHFLLYIK